MRGTWSLWLRALAALGTAALVACGGPDRVADRTDDGGVARVAVAANFVAVQDTLQRLFEASGPYRLTVSAGSTGQLYAQIVNGAPFDVFLAADAERPLRLEVDGLAVPGTRFTYALGRLALYGPTLDSVRSGGADLRDRAATRVAIANERTAPYGSAARAVLDALGLGSALDRRLVHGASIGQTYQFVRSGGAELGFVALSQVTGAPRESYWLVPDSLHPEIRQDAVLLAHGAAGPAGPAARAYLAFLRSDQARAVIASFGYALDHGEPLG